MKKFIALLGFVVSSFFSLDAQTLTIHGQLVDAEGRSPLQGATVVLRSLRDTAHPQTTYTDTSGHFQFDELGRDSFRITVSSIGYENFSRMVRVDSVSVNVGTWAIPKTSKELQGVTVTAAVPPAQQKGDTVQFNASQYKVNPDATSEDLVRKIPGITVENGQVKANGETVQKVTIDGRELFGDDATAALRNLPAEIIDKIQVFDRLSDQAQFTGFDDGNTTKGINIITKANMRNGQFGRVYAGYGTDSRYQAGGNTSFFHENRRISLVGNFNNINQQNFSQQDLLGVTSNAQRGGGGGGARGARGGGQGGNHGPQNTGGNQGGGNFGGFGNSSNFLVGQQNGINKTNAFGINYSDMWGKKWTVTGSYFFNATNNNTSEIDKVQYFADSIPNNTDTTLANSRNINHRVNMRMEWRIDSNNQIIMMPNLSFQNNGTDRNVSRLTEYKGVSNYQRINNFNNSNSNRWGNNLNNTILYRHSFAKKGRTFSINLNTSYNQRMGESYVHTLQQAWFTSGSMDDTASQRFTDQDNHGFQVSTNLVYTEPLGAKSQLQFNYNPTFSKSIADQSTYGLNPSDNKYSMFLDSLSNRFENSTTAQNAGLSYRMGERDRQLSFGVNYQHTALNSDQTFPRSITIDKAFNNVLPNAMIRYKLSAKSSLRLFYRASVNTPSVTQLQGVIDVSNAPNYTIGNPDLSPQYTHTLSTQYTYTNTAKSILFMGNVFLQAGNNYIANANYIVTSRDTVVGGQVLKPGSQLTKPVNLDGYKSLRSFLTFAIPIKPIKTNLNLNGGFTYSRLPGILNSVQNITNNYAYTLGTVFASNISQYVDFTISYSGSFNNVRSSVKSQASTSNYYAHTIGGQINLLNKKGWFFQSDINNQYTSGLANYFLWNAGIGKKFLKDQKGELRLNVFDILNQNQSVTRNVTESYIEDVQNQVLRQYFMLTFTYNLRNFGKPAKNLNNRSNRRNFMGGM